MRNPAMAGFLAFILPLVFFPVSSPAAQAPETDVLTDPLAVFTEDGVRRHVTFLASPKLEGRCTGEKGCWRAGDYVRDQFKAAGLSPVKGSYFQEYSVRTISQPDLRSRMTLVARGREYKLKVKEHFLPFGFSSEDEARGRIVFAGYGITAPDHGYDDYEGIDVRGKVVLVLRHGPGGKNPKSPFAGRRGTRHTAFTAKAANAKAHGALAMLLFSDPAHHPGPLDSLDGFSAMGSPCGLPCYHIKRRVAAAILACERQTPGRVQARIDRDLAPHSFVISDCTVSLKPYIAKSRKKTRNVVGLLEGSDPVLKKQIIVVGAHYDHIGRGYFGTRDPKSRGKIHPGADDNATGTTGLILLARAFAGMPFRPRRSILFIAFSGEEMGLLGATHYANHPLYPIENTVAMLNMDMLGYCREGKVFVMGCGTSPGFTKMVQDLTREVPVNAVAVPNAGGSDQMAFYAKKIPVLFVCTGGHPNYHTPRDTVDKINFKGEADVLKLVYLLIARITALGERPKFSAMPRGKPRALRNQAKKARLGVIPNLSYGGTGVKIQQVMPGSASARAGMRSGDVIVKIGKWDITNMGDLGQALTKVDRRARVSIIVLRDDVRKDLWVQFEKR